MSDTPVEIEFLTVEVVLALHQRQLEHFGVAEGRVDKIAIATELERIAKSKPVLV